MRPTSEEERAAQSKARRDNDPLIQIVEAPAKLMNRLREYFFPYVALTQEEKKQIITNIPNSKESKKIKSKNDRINIGFNIIQSAIGGVMFQYFRNYTGKGNDLSEDLNDVSHSPLKFGTSFVNQNKDMVFGIAICFTTAIALSLIQKLILSQDSKSYKLSEITKNKIDALTPALLRKGIDDLNNDPENALNIKMPKKIDPLTAQRAAYTIGGAIVALSSISENQQYLIFAACVAMTKFILEQYNKRIDYVPSMNSCVESLTASKEAIQERDAAIAENSITGSHIAQDFSETEMQELRTKIKQEMQLTLAKKSDTQTDVIHFFGTLAKTFAFFSTVHNRPGSLIIPDEFVASGVDFAIGSFAYNITEQLEKALSKKDTSILPGEDFVDLELQEHLSEVELPENPNDEIRPSSAPNSHKQNTGLPNRPNTR